MHTVQVNEQWNLTKIITIKTTQVIGQVSSLRSIKHSLRKRDSASISQKLVSKFLEENA